MLAVCAAEIEPLTADRYGRGCSDRTQLKWMGKEVVRMRPVGVAVQGGISDSKDEN